MQVLQLPLGPLQTNCYLLACEETNKAAVVDPSWDGQLVADMAKERQWDITHILLTHCHFDHIGGLAELKEAVDVPIFVHPDAVPMLQRSSEAASLFGLTIPPAPPADELLSEGQIIKVGNLSLHVLYTPGHAPGHVSFHLQEHAVIFDGDVLFQQGIGRTDLEGGDYPTLINSIREKLLTLPDETRVLSGHGPATTIGDERRWNPFLR